MELRVSLSGEHPLAESMSEFASVGLLRGEFLFRDQEQYVTVPEALDHLKAYLDEICAMFVPRPVWYRTCDFWSDEANILAGNDREMDEQNPILGHRGIRRGLGSPASFRMELDAVAEVAGGHPNLHLLFPFVTEAEEIRAAAAILRQIRWPNAFGTMIEIPSAVLEVRRFAELGATNFLVGMNDLSCLFLGRERGGAENKLHRAIWWAIDHIAASVPSGTEWGIGGSLSPKILEQARRHRVPYATLHYGELPELVGAYPESFPGLDHVRGVKLKTRSLVNVRSRQRIEGR